MDLPSAAVGAGTVLALAGLVVAWRNRRLILGAPGRFGDAIADALAIVVILAFLAPFSRRKR